MDRFPPALHSLYHQEAIKKYISGTPIAANFPNELNDGLHCAL